MESKTNIYTLNNNLIPDTQEPVSSVRERESRDYKAGGTLRGDRLMGSNRHTLTLYVHFRLPSIDLVIWSK